MTGSQGGRPRTRPWRAQVRIGLLAALGSALFGTFASAAPPVRGVLLPVRAPDPKQLLRQIKASGPKAVLDTLRRDQWPPILQRIETGDTAWLNVAVALDGTADADLAGSLTLAVGVALVKAPRTVLGILGGAMPVYAVCGFPDLGDPRTNTQKKVLHYLTARESAVRKLKSVPDPQVRNDCLAVLDRRLRDVAGPDGPFSH